MVTPKTLKVDKIYCEYEKRIVVSDVTFEVKRGDHAALLGPSGCGKTTILKAIAGFVRLKDGEISIDGKTVSDKNQLLSPELRRVGMVFQEHALFPHLNVEKNIAVGLRKTNYEKKNRIIENIIGIEYEDCCYKFRLVGRDRDYSNFNVYNNQNNYQYLQDAWKDLIEIQSKGSISFEFELKGFNSSFDKVGRLFNNSLSKY